MKNKRILFLLIFCCLLFFKDVFFKGYLPIATDSLVGLYHPYRDLLANKFPRGYPFKNFLITDPVRQQIPWRKTAMQSMLMGQFPSWNPYDGLGNSLLGNSQSAVFFPLNLLLLILPIQIGYTLLVIIQSCISVVGMYFLLRKIGRNAINSIIGGIGWCFSGVAIAWLSWGTIGYIQALMPWMLYFIFSIDTKSSLHNIKYFNLWLICVFCSVSAGHIQMSFYTTLFSVCYAFYLKKPRILLHSLKQISIFRKVLEALFCVAFSLSILLVTYPIYRDIIVSVRFSGAEQNYMNEGFFVPLVHGLQFIAPDYFGNPATLNYWGTWNYGEFVTYSGTLIVFGFILYLIHVNKSENKFFFIALVISCLFSFDWFLAKIPYILHIPLISSLQPTRLLSVAVFSIIILATEGLEFFDNRKMRQSIFITVFFYVCLWLSPYFITTVIEQRLIIIRNLVFPTISMICILVIYIALNKIRKKKMFAILLCTMLIIIHLVDLYRFGWKFTPFISADYFFPETSTVTYLEKRQDPKRIVSLDESLFPPNVLGYYGLESVNSYNPVHSYRYEAFIAALNKGSAEISEPFGFHRIVQVKNIDSILFPLLSTKYVLSLGKLNRNFLKEVFSEGETTVYEDSRALPRVYFADSVELSAPDKILSKLYDKLPNDPYLAVIESSVIPIPTIQYDTSNALEITEYSPNKITVNVDSKTTQFVVFSVPFHYSWKAKIIKNGNVSYPKLFPVNYLFQGLFIEPGNSEISLFQEPYL